MFNSVNSLTILPDKTIRFTFEHLLENPMGTASSHESRSRPAVGGHTLLQDRGTLPKAAPYVPKKRGLRIEDLLQNEVPPTKRRRVEPPDRHDKCNLQRFVVRYPGDDLRTFHTQLHQPNRDFDALAKVRNAPPDVTISGPLPPILLPRHGLLDGLAAIHNAPSVLLAPLPPIKALNDEEVVRLIHEPSPLRPWQLFGNQPSLLVDMERTATEYVEDRVSSLNDDGTMPEDHYHAQSGSVLWGAETVWDEGSPDYSPSPIPSVFTPPPATHHAGKLGDSAKLGGSTSQPTGVPQADSPPGYMPGVTSPIWSPHSPPPSQEHTRTSPAPDDAEAEWRDDSSITLVG